MAEKVAGSRRHSRLLAGLILTTHEVDRAIIRAIFKVSRRYSAIYQYFELLPYHLVALQAPQSRLLPNVVIFASRLGSSLSFSILRCHSASFWAAFFFALAVFHRM